MAKTLDTIISRRFSSHKGRSIRLGIKVPIKEDFEKIVFECFDTGGRCHYCEQELKINSVYPYKDTISIDHKIPLALGGTNNIHNLAVCCHQCNIIKSTLSYYTYLRLLNLLKKDKELFDKIFEEIFRGSLANKIERFHNEKLKNSEKGF